MKRRWAILILLGAAACSPPKKKNGVEPEPGKLQVNARLETGAIEGEHERFRVRIRNGTKSYAVLLDLVDVDSGRPVLRWQVSRRGRILYDEDTDSFLYHRKERGKDRPVFNLALLAPGEEISLAARLRLLNLPKKLQLRYFSYDADELSRRAYFPGKAESGTRYIRLVAGDLEDRLHPNAKTDTPSHRTVVFPFAEQVGVKPLQREMILQADITPRTFTLQNAIEKAGWTGVDQHTYYANLNLWVLRSKKKTLLVSPSQLILLPPIRNLARFFHFLDASPHEKLEVEFRKDTRTIFARDYKLVRDRTGRYLSFLPRDEILPFLKDVRKWGVRLAELKKPTTYRLELDVELAQGGGGRILVSR